MAWAATETFDTLTDGDLSGQGSGTGWSGNWSQVAGTGTATVQGTVTQSGAKGVKIADTGGTGEVQIVRQLASATTSGVARCYFRSATTNDNNIDFRLLQGSAEVDSLCSVRLESTGNIEMVYGDGAGGNASLVVMSSYSADTWYAIDIEYDTSINQYRARVDGGTWTAWKNFIADRTSTGITYIGIYKNNVGAGTEGDKFFDSVQDGSTVTTAADDAIFFGCNF